jgi:hypothetical protein
MMKVKSVIDYGPVVTIYKHYKTACTVQKSLSLYNVIILNAFAKRNNFMHEAPQLISLF